MSVAQIMNSARDDIDPVSAYPGPVMLCRSAKKWGWTFFAAAMFAAGSAGMTLNGELEPGMGWFGAIFFALGAVVSAVVLLFPRRQSITFGPHDFEVFQLFRHWRARWENVSECQVWTYPAGPSGKRNRRVVFDDRTKTRPSPITGHTGYIPDTYGLTADTLADVMNRWRAKVLAAQSAQSEQ
jgi:hypothetical protein